MLVKQRVIRKPEFWRRAVIITLLLLILIFFWNDIFGVFWALFWAPLLRWLGLSPAIPPQARVAQAIEGFIKLLIVFGLFLPSIAFIVSQFILPVQSLQERRMVFDRMFRFMIGRHGPAIFIREGKEVANPEEMRKPWPGVAFVDMGSAVVLEKLARPEPPPPNSWGVRLARLQGRTDWMLPPPMARVEGPGIVFIEPGERIHSIADLRKQFRIQLNVKAATSDGIEIECHVLSIFTLGQPPDVVKVAYVGEEKPENVRLLVIGQRVRPNPKRGQPGQKDWIKVDFVKKISSNNDELDLDDEDKIEVHRFAQDRRAMHDMILHLAASGHIDEPEVVNFVKSLNPHGKDAVLRFVSSLFAEDKAALHKFIDRMAPVDTPATHRFVIDRITLYELVAALAPKGDRAVVDAFIDDLFSRYRAEVGAFFDGFPPEAQEKLKDFLQKYASTYPIPRPPRPRPPKGWTPFEFDRERVFAALYSKARNIPRGSTLDDWTELPTQVAINIFREFISKVNYDDIYLPDVTDRFPLAQELKPRFGKLVRYQGLLSYQFMRRRDGQVPRVGDEVTPQEYIPDYPVLALRQWKSLRDRGIKVIAGSFSEIRVNDKVRQQRVDSWRARWQKEADITLADFDLEMTRIRNHARAQAQRDMALTLAQIFQSTPHSDEAMALRIFQALESAAADPTTRQLLPQDTIAMLGNLRFWLMSPEGQSPPSDGGGSASADNGSSEAADENEPDDDVDEEPLT